jgi:hypothetical protein
MSTYKGIFGKTIKHLSSDPDNSTYEGQIWYNTTEGKFKTVLATAAWSSGAPISNPRRGGSNSSNAARDSAWFASGYNGTADSSKTEEYNGSGWSSGGDVNTGRNISIGFGTQTAGVMASGYDNGPNANVANVEEYDGSTWTEVTDIPSARRSAAGFGTQTAGVVAGGVDTASNSTSVFEYDGTNWTSVTALPTGQDRLDSAGAGTQTAGFMAAGDNRTSFLYDGTNWTTGPSTSSDHDGGADTGVQTAALTYAGFLSPGSGQVTSTEVWDGTSFSTSPASMATGRYAICRAGTSNSAAIAAGGDTNPGLKTDTEEYNFTANTITAAAWASANPMPSAQSGSGGTGNTTSGLVGPGDTGGSFPSWPARTLEFDGTNWSSGGDYYSAGTAIGFCGGTHAEMMGVGINKNGPVENTGATYDGSSWTTIGNTYPQNIADMWAAGTNTASIWFGGGTGPFGGNPVQTGANSWNGSSWTAETALPEARNSHRSAGTSTLLVAWGASGPAAAPQSSSIEYNGTSWSAGGDLVKNFQGGGGAGTQTSAFAFQPSASPQTVTCQYDGTAWATSASNTTSRPNAAAFGTSTSSAIIGGYYPNIGTTEEFTGETVALNIESVDNS